MNSSTSLTLRQITNDTRPMNLDIRYGRIYQFGRQQFTSLCEKNHPMIDRTLSLVLRLTSSKCSE